MHHNPDIVWLKKDEVRYRGRMFDISCRLYNPNGTVSLIGHYDKKEDVLFALLNILVDEEDPFDGGGHKIATLWEYVAVLPSINSNFLLAPVESKSTTSLHINARYSKVFLCPPAPPPDVAC
jgi:hypothetical protein